MCDSLLLFYIFIYSLPLIISFCILMRKEKEDALTLGELRRRRLLIADDDAPVQKRGRH